MKQFSKQIKVVCCSIGIAIMFMFITYLTMNCRVSLTSEAAKLQLFEKLKKVLITTEEQSECDSVLLINTYYDQALVMKNIVKNEVSLPEGQIPVVDRRKLFHCLNLLKERNDYKYIILDVFLGKNVAQTEDSSLYRLIAEMPRTIIAQPPYNEPLATPYLEKKSGSVQYSLAFWNSGFVKYPYFTENKKSVPLRMYEDMTGRTITKKGFFYWDEGLARSSVILTYYPGFDAWTKLGGFSDYTIDDAFEKKGTAGKYILIGDFVEDLHSTFQGEQPGTLINFYAYLTLLHGHHRITWGVLLLMLLFFSLPIYFKLTDYQSIRRLTHITRKEDFQKPQKYSTTKSNSVLRFVKEFVLYFVNKWVGYPLYLTLICLFMYLFFNEAYDIFITTLLYYIMEVVIICYQKVKQ